MQDSARQPVSEARPYVLWTAGLDDGRHALVLEYMAGGSLAEYLRLGTSQERPMEQTLLPRIAREVAGGLLYLHRTALLHRDVKAANILLTANGTDGAEVHAKVADVRETRFTQHQGTITPPSHHHRPTTNPASTHYRPTLKLPPQWPKLSHTLR